MKKEHDFVKAKLIFRGGWFFTHTRYTSIKKYPGINRVNQLSPSERTGSIASMHPDKADNSWRLQGNIFEKQCFYRVDINPIDTAIFFDACVPGVCEKSPPPWKSILLLQNHILSSWGEINSALFLCTVLFSSSILMNFSDFG